MSEVRRLQELERAVIQLQSDMKHHTLLCEARMRVLWKLAGGLSAVVAAAVAASISLLR